MRIVLLCGGVGGAKMALGLYSQYPEADLTIVVNTGDDLEFMDLRVCPDLDTVTYTLAGVVNDRTGWGLAGDTTRALDRLSEYGQEAWFRIGDGDLATHLLRSARLRQGSRLTEVSEFIRRRLGVRATILPMCDEPVATEVRTDSGWLGFQEYFVKRGYRDRPLAVRHTGAELAYLTPEVANALDSADVIVIAPSNPVVSIQPIMNVHGFVDAIKAASAPKLAVSPFVGQMAITGPAGGLMLAAGFDSTVVGLADMYHTWVSTLVIASQDEGSAEAIRSKGLRVACTDIMMPNLDAKRRLAAFVIGLA